VAYTQPPCVILVTVLHLARDVTIVGGLIVVGVVHVAVDCSLGKRATESGGRSVKVGMAPSPLDVLVCSLACRVPSINVGRGSSHSDGR
jgi:hypothetical protein